MVFKVNYTEQIGRNPYAQWLATIGAFFLMMQVGIQLGWTSPNIARLTGENSDIPLTSNQASWVVSCGTCGGLIGAILGLICIEFLGSKNTVLLTFVLISFVWVCTILANSPEWLYTARTVGGSTLAISYCSFPMFLGEISVPRIRGTLISIAAGGSPVGVVIGTIAETYLPMKISSSIYLAQSLAMIMLFTWLMDSPSQLVKLTNLERAREAISFYNINNEVEEELNEIKSFLEADDRRTIKAKLEQFKIPTNRKSLILITMLFALPHVSGNISIISYMELILINGKSHLIKPQEFVIYANIVCAISTFLTLKLTDSLGRRFLLIVSSIGTTIAMLALGTHFYLLSSNFDSEKLQWLAITSILMYLVTYSVGYGPVPSVVLSEIFPDNCKSLAALAATISTCIVGFTISKSYQPMAESMGEVYVFWIYAALSILSSIFVLFLLPETKRKTFQEIQNILANR